MTLPLKTQPPVELVAPGIWMVPTVVPDNPIGWTQTYLIESSDGPYLVDTGWNHDLAWADLMAGLVTCGTSVEEVRGVIVTHHHPDHLGLVGRVREASGCWVGMHDADTSLVKQHREILLDDPSVLAAETITLLQEADAGPCEIDEMMDAHQAFRMEVPELPDRHLGTQTLQLGDRRVDLQHTPGHTPGHLCLRIDGRLLTGDHLLKTISSHVGLYGFEADDKDPLGDYFSSLRLLTGAEPVEVLPAHRGRFTGVDARVAELLEHHADRLAEIRTALASGPLAPWALCRAMTWNRPWDELPRGMLRAALAEAMAHVRLLERSGDVVVVRGTPTQVRLT
ncbi:MAG: putative metal dependent hydrolase [Frankiales bacterium]|nr:putative metal dependent hydrolase [Frankiales bacterium]